MSQPHPPTSYVRPEFIRLTNRIAGQHRPLRFEWNGQPAVFTFSAQRLAPRGAWSMDIVLGGHDLRVELSRLPDLAWVSPTLAGIDLQSLPPELGMGLISTCLGDIFEALSKSGIDVRISAIAPRGLADTQKEVIEWCVDRGTDTGWMRGRITGNDAALEHLANHMQRAPLSAPVDDAKLPMPVQLVAGSLTLPLAELRAIGLHDVLLADLNAFATLKTCQLRCGQRLLGTGTLNTTTFTLQNLTSAEATTMGAPAASLDTLDIELTFVAGQHTLTLGELRTLAPGFVFELNTLADEPLTICANGKPIGTGELIEVGGRRGVRVNAFSAP